MTTENVYDMKALYEKLTKQLPPLIDVTETFNPDSVFDENERASLVETCAELITDFIEHNPLVFSKPDYSNIIRESVLELMEETIFPCVGVIENEEIQLIYQMASYIVFSTIAPRRSYRKTFIRKLKPNTDVIKQKLQAIRDRPQSEQCTPQWYLDRWNRLSGSNAWKAFGSQAQVNSLILEKCKPIDVGKYRNVNTESPLHHGKRFEPVSIQYYEYTYGAKVDEFGCVPHGEHSFLGASPDGIIVNEDCSRFGRMLEIKNVTTRKITGIPKEDYWIQMQIQMEVCRLPECDFLETKFVEYEDECAFDADSNKENDETKWNYNLEGKRRGVIVYFIKDDKPIYEYAPLNLSKNDFDVWYNETMEKNKELTWIENIYWYLEDISIVLVTRNRKWYNAALPKMIETWETIVKERKEGYDHRKPNKRVKKDKPSTNTFSQIYKQEEPNDNSPVINFQHDVNNNDDSDISSDNFNFSYLNQKKDKKVIIKINTEKL